MRAGGLFVVRDGGRGEGLRPLTDNLPKCLLRFGPQGRLIDFSLASCLEAGEDDVVIVSPYFSRQIEVYVRFYWTNVFSRQRRKVILLPATSSRGTSSPAPGGAELLFRWLSRRSPRPRWIAFLTADLVCSLDYRPAVSFHLAEGAEVTVGVVVFAEEPEKGRGFSWAAEAGQQGRGGEVLARLSGGAEAGFYVFSWEGLMKVLEHYRGEDRPDFVETGARELAAAGKAAGWLFEVARGSYRTVNDLYSYWLAHMDMVEGRLQLSPFSSLPLPARPPVARFNRVDRYVSAGKQIINSMISPSAHIGRAMVERAVIGPGVQIEDHAEVCSAVVLDGAVIHKGAQVREAVVESQARIRAPLAEAGEGRILPGGLHLMTPLSPSVSQPFFSSLFLSEKIPPGNN